MKTNREIALEVINNWLKGNEARFLEGRYDCHELREAITQALDQKQKVNDVLREALEYINEQGYADAAKPALARADELEKE